jgi:tartrate-resistant acid phosphatase type 5
MLVAFIRIFRGTAFFLFFISSQLYPQSPLYRFAIIGDFGYAGQNEFKVSELVKSWHPDFILSLGDNNYELGEAETIDENIGKYYHEFIYPYKGAFGKGDTVKTNRFFPCLGNHDWYTNNAEPYLDYFALPGNERYYDFVRPPVHFFVIDSDFNEPDGISGNSTQARWLRNALAESKQRFKVVYFHEPPYSSGPHGGTETMRWDFKKWLALLVITGHDHDYERLFIDKFTYLVNGLGGRSIYKFDEPVEGSMKRYNGNYGAQLASVFRDSINFSFISISGRLIDSYTFTFIPTKLRKEEASPDEFLLFQNGPNPVKEKSKIKFQIPKLSQVKLSIIDALAQEIGVLEDELLLPGIYEVEFDVSNLPSGVYLYLIKADVPGTIETFSDTKKMAITK